MQSIIDQGGQWSLVVIIDGLWMSSVTHWQVYEGTIGRSKLKDTQMAPVILGKSQSEEEDLNDGKRLDSDERMVQAL